MLPAYHIPLNDKELANLGLLTVILGQVDDLMIKTVAHHLSVDRVAANVIMGSSKVADTAAIWAETIRTRTKDDDIRWLVKVALEEIQNVSAARNDFIHAVFSDPMQMVGGAAVYGGPADGSSWLVDAPTGPMAVSRRPPLARRVRKLKVRSVSDLPDIVSQAARLSCLVAHIDHLLVGNPATSSPWLERLGPTLPPRPDTAAAHKGKAQRGRHRPSQK